MEAKTDKYTKHTKHTIYKILNTILPENHQTKFPYNEESKKITNLNQIDLSKIKLNQSNSDVKGGGDYPKIFIYQ